MVLLEQMLEQQLAAALQAVLAQEPAIPCQVHRAWEEWPEGATADTATPGCLALYVTVQPRSYPEWIIPVCSMEVAVGLVFPWEIFPDRAGLAAITQRVFAKLESWQCSHDAVIAELSVDDVFRADGFRLAGGRRVDNANERATVVTQALSVLGVVLKGDA